MASKKISKRHKRTKKVKRTKTKTKTRRTRTKRYLGGDDLQTQNQSSFLNKIKGVGNKILGNASQKATEIVNNASQKATEIAKNAAQKAESIANDTLSKVEEKANQITENVTQNANTITNSTFGKAQEGFNTMINSNNMAYSPNSLGGLNNLRKTNSTFTSSFASPRI